MPGLFGGNGGQTKQQQDLTTSETNLVNTGLAQASTTIPAATSAATSGLDYFQALLSGDRGKIMSAISPEVSSLTSQYASAAKTSQEFAPRGGGRAAALEERPYTQAGSIEQLVQGAQATGAAGVGGFAQILASLGLGEEGVSSSTAANAFGQLETTKENQQQQQAAAGAAIGGLVSLLAGF